MKEVDNTQTQFLAKVRYCQAYQMTSQLWEVGCKLNAFDSPSYKAHHDALSARMGTAMLDYQNAGGLLIDTMLNGWSDQYDMYAVAETLKAKFGNQISAEEDSELFVYYPLSWEDKIVSFLKKRYPSLTYNISNMERPELPGVGNTPAVNQFLQQQNISLETSAFNNVRPDRSPAEIEEFVNAAVDELVKTGLTLEQTLSHVRDELKNRGL